ncbi:FecR family protein [Pedobacter sp. ASV1-7]|uniref:FecR family protein n=1 Tax=Pedobacter sp. ASV1-7 TaxID=3145237 RepID=UPI0032E8EED4
MTDELLIKFLLKETAEDEHISVQNWINASPANKEHFTKFEKIWNSSKNLSTKKDISEIEAWERFKQKAHVQQPEIIKIKPNFGWLKIAAVLFVIAASWSLYQILSPVSYIPVLAGNKVTTKILPDGSEITLNKNAKISYANNFKNNRTIHLEKGSVFFNVVHDKTKPFVIDIDKISVLVVGTSFNIKHLKEQTEVIVETGIVKVSLNKEEINLQKGEKVIIKNNVDQLVKTQNTDQLYNYYRSNELVTNNTPLWHVVEVINEAYGSTVIIKDPAIKGLSLNTTLKTSASLEDNLQVICKTLNLTLIRNQNEIILSNHQ